MPSSFPSSPDNIQNNVANSTTELDTHPNLHNKLADAVNAVEAALLPGGTMNLAAHLAAADPHAVYLTQTEGDARYSTIAGGIPDGSITSAKIADATIQAADIANGTITSVKIADGAIQSNNIQNLAVDTNALASGAVTSAKIADGTIATVDLANGAVTNAKLASDTARANLLTNGGMTVWSRGTGAFTTNLAYTADRWQISLNGTSTLSVTQQSSTPPPSNSSQRVLLGTYTHNAPSAIVQTLKTAESVGLNGRSVAVSMALYTSTGSAVRLALASDGSGALNVQSAFHAGDSAWHVYTVTGTVPADATYIQVQILLSVSCTVIAANAMLVVGSVPADYAPLHPADDLARCLRYYEVAGPTAASVTVSGIATAGGQSLRAYLRWTRKAITPTVTRVGTFSLGNASGQPTIPAVDVDGGVLQATSSAAGDTYAQNAAGTSYLTMESNP